MLKQGGCWSCTIRTESHLLVSRERADHKHRKVASALMFRLHAVLLTDGRDCQAPAPLGSSALVSLAYDPYPQPSMSPCRCYTEGLLIHFFERCMHWRSCGSCYLPFFVLLVASTLPSAEYLHESADQYPTLIIAIAIMNVWLLLHSGWIFRNTVLRSAKFVASVAVTASLHRCVRAFRCAEYLQT